MKQKKSRWLTSSTALGFLIPFCGMLLVMLICGYKPFGAKAMLYSDCYHQYYPFFAAFRRALLSGDSLLYNWDIGMGVDYLGMIAYYLASPLNLLGVLVPESQLLNFFCLLMPVKLGLAGMFFTMFLKGAFGRDDVSVSIFGAFYALCAWALGYQWNVMWLDTFALLPLVMLGMVSLLRDRKFVLYTVALFLSVFSNYYIGFFTCIFVLLTFFCYEICRFRGWKRFFADLMLMGVFSLIAIGMTAVLTLTALSALQMTQSSVNKFPTGFRLNIASSHDLKGLLDGMRQVAGNMGGGLEPSFKEGLPNLYCGVGSILLGILFLMSGEVKLRDKLCSLFLLIFFMLSFLIRQLDYIWHGFHFPNMIPYRFSFLYSFVLLCMAYRAWMLRSRFDRLQVFAAALLTGAILCCSDSLLDTQSATFFGRNVEVPVYIIYNVSFLLVFTVILMICVKKPKRKDDDEDHYLLLRRKLRRTRKLCRSAFLMVLALELTATLTAFGCYFPGTQVSNYPKGTDETASMIRYMHQREEDTLFYRAEVTHTQTLNDGALNDYSGITAFTSSANVHITQFMKALGYGAKNTYNRYAYEESSPVAELFLGLKYLLDRDGKDKSSSVYQQVHHFGQVYLYENTAYLPLGFLAELELGELDFLSGDDSFGFQNALFRAATNIPGDVWYVLPRDQVEILGSGVDIGDNGAGGYCTYSNPTSGANVIYSAVADRDGFACVRLDLPKRNDFYVSINGVEQYRETISLPQMIAVGQVHEGDIIDIRIVCGNENGSADVDLAIMDDELFHLGHAMLEQSVLELTSFSGLRVTGTIDCNREGLLYTSIPQNGNWAAYVDGQEAQITLVGDCMIGLHLEKGSHTIEFIYRNRAFAVGAAVSAGSLAVLITLILIYYRPKKEDPLPETPEEAPEAVLPPAAEETPAPPAEDAREDIPEQTDSQIPDQQI